MSKRDSLESRILQYFETVGPETGTVIYGLVAATARRRNLTGRSGKVVKQRRAKATVHATVAPLGSDPNPSQHGA